MSKTHGGICTCTESKKKYPVSGYHTDGPGNNCLLACFLGGEGDCKNYSKETPMPMELEPGSAVDCGQKRKGLQFLRLDGNIITKVHPNAFEKLWAYDKTYEQYKQGVPYKDQFGILRTGRPYTGRFAGSDVDGPAFYFGETHYGININLQPLYCTWAADGGSEDKGKGYAKGKALEEVKLNKIECNQCTRGYRRDETISDQVYGLNLYQMTREPGTRRFIIITINVFSFGHSGKKGQHHTVGKCFKDCVELLP